MPRAKKNTRWGEPAIPTSSPSKGALVDVERLDRVAEEVFRGLNDVVADRVHTNSNPGRSSCCPSSTASHTRRPYPGPPGGMANGDILFASPRRRPPGEQAARAERLLPVDMAARGHRCRTRRRRIGGACRHAGSRGSSPSKFLNLGRGVYLIDMPVWRRRAAAACGPAASFGRRSSRMYQCCGGALDGVLPTGARSFDGPVCALTSRYAAPAGGASVLLRLDRELDRRTSPGTFPYEFAVLPGDRSPRYAPTWVQVLMTYLPAGAVTRSAGPAGAVWE